MKTNKPRRRIFDAVDLLTMPEEDPEPSDADVKLLPVDRIRPFHDHPFRLYEGERLDEMTESIREHGVLNPVIVQQHPDGYEMLAGHNRLNAAKRAGLQEIPAIVKTDLTEEEAYVYVIETNVIQRSFSELLPSEKAAVLADRYEKVVCQGKRSDILEEIERLESGQTTETCGHDVHRKKSRDSLGEEYGLGGRNCARYVRIHTLHPQLKTLLDDGRVTLISAVDLTYLSAQEQELLSSVLQEQPELKVRGTAGQVLRAHSGALTRSDILQLLTPAKKEKPSSDTAWFRQLKKQYFADDSAEEMRRIIETALRQYFETQVQVQPQGACSDPESADLQQENRHAAKITTARK